LIFLAVGIASLIAGIVGMGIHIYRLYAWERAQAVMFADNDHRPIRFTTASGEVMQVGNVITSRRRIELGERLTVHYDPSSPERAFVGLSPVALAALPLLGVGGALVGVAMYRLWRRRRGN
jgi:hypothetical protein